MSGVSSKTIICDASSNSIDGAPTLIVSSALSIIGGIEWYNRESSFACIDKIRLKSSCSLVASTEIFSSSIGPAIESDDNTSKNRIFP